MDQPQDLGVPPSPKKPKLVAAYTRTDPITGLVGRIFKRDEKYLANLTRRAIEVKARREALKQKRELLEQKETAVQKKERAEKKKRKAELRRKQLEEELATDTESESDISSEDEEDSKTEDKKLVPFYSLTSRFTNHVCVITGAGRGIGQACAIRLAQEGGIIYLLDNKRFRETMDMVEDAQKRLHNKEYQDKVMKYESERFKFERSVKNKGLKFLKAKPRKLKPKTKCFYIKTDVTDLKAVQRAVDEIIKDRNYIDVVLNCINKEYDDVDSHNTDNAKFDRTMQYNVNSTVNVINTVLPHMMKAEYGRIVNLASQDGKEGKPRNMAFAAAKAAIINITKTYGKEYAGTGITVNCIAPHYDSYHVEKLSKKEQNKVKDIPMNRAIDMDELAGAVAFICSEENTYTTGFCYDLTGGVSSF